MSEGGSSLTEVLDLLRKHGERLDTEIAEEMGIPLETVRQRLSRLAATGLVVTCNLTRYKDGERVDGWLCRISGFIPSAAPGRKPEPIS
jgi:predicted ArsR family transcriptional regulator